MQTPLYRYCRFITGVYVQATCVLTFTGRKSVEKSRLIAESIFQRTRLIFKKMKIPDFEKVHVQVQFNKAYQLRCDLGRFIITFYI